MVYTYRIQSQEVKLNFEASVLTYAGKIVPMLQCKYAISYYASEALEQQTNTLGNFFEQLSGKSRKSRLNQSRDAATFQSLIPKALWKTPVYLDILDVYKKRTLVPLDLGNENCVLFLKALLSNAPNGYLGLGSEFETARALGIHASGKVVLIVLIVLGLFASMLLLGYLTSF